MVSVLVSASCLTIAVILLAKKPPYFLAFGCWGAVIGGLLGTISCVIWTYHDTTSSGDWVLLSFYVGFLVALGGSILGSVIAFIIWPIEKIWRITERTRVSPSAKDNPVKEHSPLNSFGERYGKSAFLDELNNSISFPAPFIIKIRGTSLIIWTISIFFVLLFTFAILADLSFQASVTKPPEQSDLQKVIDAGMSKANNRLNP